MKALAPDSTKTFTMSKFIDDIYHRVDFDYCIDKISLNLKYPIELQKIFEIDHSSIQDSYIKKLITKIKLDKKKLKNKLIVIQRIAKKVGDARLKRAFKKILIEVTDRNYHLPKNDENYLYYLISVNRSTTSNFPPYLEFTSNLISSELTEILGNVYDDLMIPVYIESLLVPKTKFAITLTEKEILLIKADTKVKVIGTNEVNIKLALSKPAFTILENLASGYSETFKIIKG